MMVLFQLGQQACVYRAPHNLWLELHLDGVIDSCFCYKISV